MIIPATPRVQISADVNAKVSITEQRAPTDESVKLLREMEQKARDEVLKSVAVGDTPVECVVHRFTDHLSDRSCWRAIFKINERVLKAEIWENGCRGPAHMVEAEKLFEQLRDEMAKVIATELLNKPFTDTLRKAWAR